MYFLLNMVILFCHVTLPEGIRQMWVNKKPYHHHSTPPPVTARRHTDLVCARIVEINLTTGVLEMSVLY